MQEKCKTAYLQTCTDQKVNKHRFYLCLSRFEIISTDKYTMSLGKINHTWHIGVLRRSIDIRTLRETDKK